MSDPPAACELQIRVRYSECDAMGVVHHARYAEYFEMGRTELLRQAGFRYRDLEHEGVCFVVVRLECRFRSPARYDDLLSLTTRMERVTRARIDHAYELRRDGVLLCEGRTTLACVGPGGKVRPVPEKVGQLPVSRWPAVPSGPAATASEGENK